MTLLKLRAFHLQPLAAWNQKHVGQIGGRAETGEKIRRALEKAGIEFTNGDGLGVRLKKKRR